MRTAAGRNPTELATMADSSEQNPMETENPPDGPEAEVFHDASTVHTGENAMLTGAEWKEIYLLMEITYSNKTEVHSSPEKHMSILKALGDAFNNTKLEIFDNKNRKLSLDQCSKMKNVDTTNPISKSIKGMDVTM